MEIEMNKEYKNEFKNPNGYRVIGDRILVERDEASTKTAGGIIMPDSSVKASLFATVIGVGRDVTEIMVGDVVTFSKISGIEINIDGRELTVLKEHDVFLIVKRSKEKGAELQPWKE